MVEQADMRTARSIILFLAIAALGLMQLTRSADAGTVQFCVACTEPAQTYVCNVETPHTFQNNTGLQLFCIVRISKDGGHRSCTVDQSKTGNCSDVIKSYSFNAPEIPDGVKRALAKRQQKSSSDTEQMATPPQRGGEPETFIDMTRGAVGASREGLRTTGEAVGSATNKVGEAARGVGRGAVSAVGKVGSAGKKTGSAVGGAAKTAWECVRSLFKKCGSSEQRNDQ